MTMSPFMDALCRTAREQMEREEPEQFAFLDAKVKALTAATSGVLAELPIEIVGPLMIVLVQTWHDEFMAKKEGRIQ